MNLLEFPKDVVYGSIYDLNMEFWWEINEEGKRSIPNTPDFIFEIMQYQESDNLLRIEGLLTNEYSEELVIPIFPSPKIFHCYFRNDPNIVQYIVSPKLPSAPPPPYVLKIPPTTQVIFTTTINFSEYIIKSQKDLIVDWKFMTWDSKEKHSGYFRL